MIPDRSGRATAAVNDGGLLRTEKLTRHFGTLMAVRQVDLAVHAGELRAIIGPNGAGKSTLFKLIAGEVRPSAGKIFLDGRDITGLPQFAASQLGIAKSFQITTIFPGLSVFENVRIAVQCRRSVLNCWMRADRLPGVRERTREILAAVALEDKAYELAAHLGHGLQRHLELGIALACEPRLLLLDEPTAGMSPEETERTIALIREVGRGRTVILVEHKMNVVMDIADRITVLHEGAVLAEGTPDEIRRDSVVQQVYLGARLSASATRR
jgi:branched-chain amino acid transport system ATP-binding protein